MTSISVPNRILLPEVERLLREGRRVTLRTRGHSMLPFIVGGRDSVVLRPPTLPLQPGRIVLARIGQEQYVLHRIMLTDAHRVTLMGDGNLRGQETCRPEDVCGEVEFVLRPGHQPVSPDSPRWQRASAWWQKLRPIRRLILAVYRRTLLKRYENQS